jgi:hypothetical protein
MSGPGSGSGFTGGITSGSEPGEGSGSGLGRGPGRGIGVEDNVFITVPRKELVYSLVSYSDARMRATDEWRAN